MEPASAGEDVRGGEGQRGLEVLKQVQRLYEEKLALIERQSVEGETKLQLQVELLRSWVGDLASQNALLAGAVEDLEREATSRLMAERRTHQEIVRELQAELGALRRRLVRKDSDLRGLVEVLRRLREFDCCTLDGIHFFEKDNKKDRCDAVNELKILYDSAQKENVSKEREIRKLNKEVQQYEQTIMNLRSEISLFKYKTDVPRKDVEVMVGSCYHGRECTEPARRDAAGQFERSQFLDSFKSGGPDTRESARALLKVNAALSAETAALQRVVYVLQQQLCTADAKAHFKDEIIREMRRQLRQAKIKLKGENSAPPTEASSRLSLAQSAEPGPPPAVSASSARGASPSGRLRRPRAVRRDSAPRLEPGSDSDTRDCDLDGSGGDGLVNLPN